MNGQREISPIPGISVEDLNRFVAIITEKVLEKCVDGNQVFTRIQAAEFLRYDPSVIDRLRAAGKIKVHKVTENGDPRYLKSDLIEYVKNN